MSRDSYLRKKYGITERQYDALLAVHDGGCWICGRKPKPGGRRLHVEHDHKTGVVRGLACWNCNRGLQCFRDDPNIMRIGAQYLRSTRAQQILNESAA